jgi:hypothetical protein
LVVVIIPLADSHVSAETKIETPLWAVGAISIGSIVAFLIEIVFASFRRADELTEGLTERLNCVEETLRLFGSGGDVAASAGSSVVRLPALECRAYGEYCSAPATSRDGNNRWRAS